MTPSFSNWFGKAALIAVCVAAIGRLGIERFRQHPTMLVQGRLLLSEKYRLRKIAEPAWVLRLGSSATEFGHSHSDFSAAAGVPPSRVRELSVKGGTAWEALFLIQRNKEFLSEVKVVTLDVVPGGGKSGAIQMLPFARYATLQDRMRADTLSQKAKYVGDFLWPFLSCRQSLREWLDGYWRTRAPERSVAEVEKRLQPPSHRVSESEVRAKMNKRFAPEAMAETIFADWEPSPRAAIDMQNFIAACRAQKIEVLIYQTPFNSAHWAAIEQNPVYIANYNRWLGLMNSLRGEGVHVVISNDQSEFGFVEGDHIDYCHLSGTGAAKASKWLGEKVREILDSKARKETK
jgi:hypothetical protein